MTEAEIIDVLRTIIRQVAPDADPDTLALDEDFRRAFDIDSFDHLRIMTAIHERFGVDVPEGEQGKLVTLTKLMEYVRTKAHG
jgi:acyl carrier protein